MEERLKKIEEMANQHNEIDHQTYLEENKLLEEQPAFLLEKVRQEKAKTKRLEEENASLRNDREARKYYGVAIFSFVVLYIIAVFSLICFDRRLSDHVTMTLLSTTSVNVIGLLMGVVRYLFPDHRK